MGGNRCTQRKRTQASGEQTNSRQKGPSRPLGWNPEASCCEATVLITAPLCCFKVANITTYKHIPMQTSLTCQIRHLISQTVKTLDIDPACSERSSQSTPCTFTISRASFNARCLWAKLYSCYSVIAVLLWWRVYWECLLMLWWCEDILIAPFIETGQLQSTHLPVHQRQPAMQQIQKPTCQHHAIRVKPSVSAAHQRSGGIRLHKCQLYRWI